MHIKPIKETPNSVTLNRADFDAIVEELEDAEDRMAVLEDCLLDIKPDQVRYLLSMAETMRIIDGVNPVTVWREKRGMTVRQLANAIALPDNDLEEIERGTQARGTVIDKLSQALEVLPDQLKPLTARP
jgi:DNA-binding Xre family transcriptional regulator